MKQTRNLELGAMHLSRSPKLAALRPLVETVWASAEAPKIGQRELVLPTGQGHLVVRISSHPLQVFPGVEARRGRRLAHAVLGGPRWSPYVRDVSRPVRSVGAQLRPGAVPLLFGIPADELSGRHTALDDLWPGARFRERLGEVESLPRQLDVFESLLAEWIPGGAVHPVVAHALTRFHVVSDVGEVVRETGYSHRQFVAVFRRAVGMPPKLFCRVRRFKAALDLLAENPSVGWANLALAAGFSDQAHFVREFRALSGLTPGQYRRLAPDWSRHVPIG